MDKDNRRPTNAGSQRDKDDKGKNEEGEEKPKLALEEFFEQYVDKWYREKKFTSVLYNRCRKEIDELKGKVKKSKIQKPKKISNENLNDEHTVRQLPDFDKKKQQMGPEKRPQELVNKGSKDKPSPISVPQEQYEMMTKKIKEQDAMDQKYQKALRKIQKLEDEMAELRMENDSISRRAEQLKGELKRSYAQTNDIQSRYSKLASETLKNGNPNIADLSDPNRPTEITKQFSELYDNEWSDAYEILTTTLKCSEEKSLQILFDTVERSFEFMEEQRNEQVNLFRQALLCPIYFVLTKEGTTVEVDLSKFITKENMEIQIKEIRKTHSPTTAKILANVFTDIELGRLLAPHEKFTNTMPAVLKKYAYRCAQLCWHMVIADPPIYMTKSVAKKPFDLEVYRPYTKSIKGQEKVLVEVDVWPALYLHAEGPLLNKGVAQPGHALQK